MIKNRVGFDNPLDDLCDEAVAILNSVWKVGGDDFQETLKYYATLGTFCLVLIHFLYSVAL